MTVEHRDREEIRVVRQIEHAQHDEREARPHERMLRHCLDRAHSEPPAMSRYTSSSDAVCPATSATLRRSRSTAIRWLTRTTSLTSDEMKRMERPFAQSASTRSM